MSTTEIVNVIHACAKNDSNGNPRRIFVGLSWDGSIVRVEDEGYAGAPSWVRERRGRGMYDFPVEVTSRQYRNFCKVKP